MVASKRDGAGGHLGSSGFGGGEGAGDPGRERRRHRRGGIVATCDVFTAEDHHGVFLVQDLSAGGARLQGEAPIAEGRALKLILQLPNRQPMDVQARLVRGHAGEGTPPSFAVAFSDLSAEDEDTIHQGLMAELERQHARRFATILVLDQAAEVRDVLEKDLRELGREAVGVATPLEAVGWLTTPGTSFDTLLVNLTSSAGPGIDVLDYVSAELPGVRRIALGDDRGAFRLELALRAGRAQAVLKAPWNRAELIGVMGGAAAKASSP